MNHNEYITDYFYKIVKPTVDEFLQNKSDLRRGRLAAIVLDHMRDYWAIKLNRHHEWSITEKLLKEQIFIHCPDAAFIRDVCNATKHGMLRADKEKNNNTFKNIPKNIHSTDQVKAENNESIFVAGFVDGVFAESNNVYIKFDEAIDFFGDNITSRFLHESINEVVEFWTNIISTIEQKE